jgi:hypothetical protein
MSHQLSARKSRPELKVTPVQGDLLAIPGIGVEGAL